MLQKTENGLLDEHRGVRGEVIIREESEREKGVLLKRELEKQRAEVWMARFFVLLKTGEVTSCLCANGLSGRGVNE